MSNLQDNPHTPIKQHALGKNAKLAEVVGVAKTVREETHRALTNVYHAFQKPGHFDGFERTYKPFSDDGEKLPPESKLVEQNARRLLDACREHLAREIDLESRREQANTIARADIQVGDEVLIANVPVTLLMPLEKQLRALRAEIDKVPTLSPSVAWSWNKEQEVWQGAPEQVNRTKKEPRVITKAEATEKHPAQAEVIYEDRAVGVFTRVQVSTAITPAEKRLLASRCATLADAVKAALERANTAPAPPHPIADKLLAFVFGSPTE